MAETNLITISDVSIYRRIDSKINQDKFDAFVSEIQRTNLRDLLGEPLYYDFFLNITEQKYIDLRDGKVYDYGGDTIQYYGLKPYLCYLWLGKYATEGEVYHSGYGSIQFNNNTDQQFEVAKERQRVAVNYKQIAQSYANDIIKYLSTFSSTYNLWESEAEINKSNFLSFKL